MFSLKYFRLILAVVALVGLSQRAFAEANTPQVPTFTILTMPNEDYPHVALGDALTVRIAGVSTDMTKASIDLRLSGELAALPHRWYPGSQQIQFDLSRNDANVNIWSRLLGASVSHPQVVQVPVDVEINGQVLSYKTDTVADHQAQSASIALIRYNGFFLGLGCLSVALGAGLLILSCAKTTVIRDSVIPQLLVHERPYSLARFQMAFWFVTILASFAYILLITHSFHSLTTESFALLGIPGATTLAAMAVDQSKSDALTKIEANVLAMGIATAEDVKNLYEATSGSGDETAAARPSIPNATLPGNPSNPNPSFKLLRQAYDKEIASIKSAGFWKDLVNDVNGPTVHRWQMLVWTIIVGAIFAWRSYADLTMPVLGNELLTLMGVSSATYVGIKIPERQI